METLVLFLCAQCTHVSKASNMFLNLAAESAVKISNTVLQHLVIFGSAQTMPNLQYDTLKFITPTLRPIPAVHPYLHSTPVSNFGVQLLQHVFRTAQPIGVVSRFPAFLSGMLHLELKKFRWNSSVGDRRHRCLHRCCFCRLWIW